MKRILNSLKSDKPFDELLQLYNDGVIKELLPEVHSLYTSVDGHKNNFLHTLKVIENVNNINGSFNMKLVALLHDIGKPHCKKSHVDKKWTFHNHEKVSAEMVYGVLDRMGVTNEKDRDYIHRMILHHGIRLPRNVTDSAVRRLSKTVGDDIIFDLIEFCKCDVTTRKEDKKTRVITALDTIKKHIKEVQIKDEDAKWRSPITGYVIMDLLGKIDGRTIGKIKSEVDPKIKSGEWTEEDGIDYIIKEYKKA